MNYYFWPPEWIGQNYGLFTGSGFPQRFAKTDGTMIDVYQAATQLVDENRQNYPAATNALLDKALGNEGFYGVFGTHNHTNNDFSDKLLSSAQSRGVSIVSTGQMLKWLDGRNNSNVSGIIYNNQQLNFSITKAAGANNLTAMLPINSDNGNLQSITKNGTPVAFLVKTIKGIDYAFFSGESGNYTAQYQTDAGDVEPPSSPSNLSANATSSTSIDLQWTASSDNVAVSGYNILRGGLVIGTSSTTSYTDASLNPNTNYQYVVQAYDEAGNVSANSNTASATTWQQADTQPPSTPTNLTATAVSQNQINLSWNASTDNVGVAKYQVFRNNNSVAIAEPSTTTFGDASVVPGTTYSYTVRAVDAAGNVSAHSASASASTPSSSSNCPCTIFAANSVPSNPSVADYSAVELGMKFRSDLPGKVTGVKFYKGAGNSGTHKGSLWTSSGTLLGRVTFTNETSSGWQQADFASLINISANTTYIVSYYAPNGRYAGDNIYFASSGVDNGPLHALADGAQGGNGVYRYGSNSFPINTWKSSNYWVDVVFTP